MSFNGTWASADGSLALNISNAGDDGSFAGNLTYAGNSYPIQNGHWHNGVTPASTYSFGITVDDPNQIYLGASGVITGAAFGGMPSQITIAGAAATITGSAPTSPNSLSLFAGILNPQN
jgi:hypothetical protein